MRGNSKCAMVQTIRREASTFSSGDWLFLSRFSFAIPLRLRAQEITAKYAVKAHTAIVANVGESMASGYVSVQPIRCWNFVVAICSFVSLSLSLFVSPSWWDVACPCWYYGVWLCLVFSGFLTTIKAISRHVFWGLRKLSRLTRVKKA